MRQKIKGLSGRISTFEPAVFGQTGNSPELFVFQRRGRERPEGTDTAGRAAETQDWIWGRLDLSPGHS